MLPALTLVTTLLHISEAGGLPSRGDPHSRGSGSNRGRRLRYGPWRWCVRKEGESGAALERRLL